MPCVIISGTYSKKIPFKLHHIKFQVLYHATLYAPVALTVERVPVLHVLAEPDHCNHSENIQKPTGCHTYLLTAL